MAATPLSLPAAGHTRRPAAINRGADGQRRARALHQPRRGEPAAPPSKGQRWGTIAYMVAIHLLAVVALLPRFWSWQAVATLLILYWVTACLGVTIGYHRLLS
ncbi:MAG: acyl-CoA desaturase, partial [Cyanobacteriota bacterium]